MNEISEIKDFTIEILEKLGAVLEFITPEILIATLPDSKEFDRDKLYISFIPVPPEINGYNYEFELLVSGSDLLDKLISIAKKHGKRGHKIFCHYPYSEAEDKSPLSFFSVKVESLQRIPNYLSVMEFNFRVTFLTDEKLESIYSIFIDENKNCMEIDTNHFKDIKNQKNEHFIDSGYNILPEEAYERAKEYVLKKIKPQMEKIEEEQESILSESVMRLESYYEQQKEYIKNRDKEEAENTISELSSELIKKKEELIDKHRVTAGIKLINFREISIPHISYQAILEKKEKRKIIHFKKDLLRGTVISPLCESCSKEEKNFTLCSEGHLLGKCCIYNCSICSSECCFICNPPTVCNICNNNICEDCKNTCPICKKYYCSEKHSVKCGICGETFCQDCMEKCFKCENPACPAHKVSCSICGNIFCIDHCGTCIECGIIVCTEDSKACPGCGNISCNSHYTKCTLCNQDYCSLCIDKKKKTPLCRGCNSLKNFHNDNEIKALSELTREVKILNLRKWKKSSMKRYDIYTASAFFNSYILVLDKEKNQIIYTGKLGFLKVLRDMF